MSGPFAGQYSSACRYSTAEDSDHPTQGLLNHYCLNVKGFTCSYVWVLEDCNTIHKL